jgi:mono/diheme cytochrome c family protein
MNHRWMNWRTATLCGAVLLHIGVLSGVALRAQQMPAAAQAPIGGLPANRTGADIYRAACVSCHGPDGRGMPRSSVGFDTPLPDFTDCSFATAEADPDWHAVVSRGGPIRGLDHHMPSFGEALSPGDISLAIGYVRSFCADRAKWPQGDLNFPRAFFTEKAFPENETVWTTAFLRAMRRASATRSSTNTASARAVSLKSRRRSISCRTGPGSGPRASATWPSRSSTRSTPA